MADSTQLITAPVGNDMIAMQNNLLGKALEVHSISLKQAFTKKIDEVEATRNQLVATMNEKWVLVRDSLRDRVDILWLERNVPCLVDLAKIYTHLLGGRKKFEIAELLNYEDAHKWCLFFGENTYSWFLDYAFRRYDAHHQPLPQKHTVTRRVNFKKSTFRWSISLRVTDPRHEGDGNFIEYPLIVKLNAFELGILKEIEEHCKQLNVIDAQKKDLTTRAADIPAQAEAMKVKVFRSELSKFDGGSQLLAELDASIASTIAGTLPELVAIPV